MAYHRAGSEPGAAVTALRCAPAPWGRGLLVAGLLGGALVVASAADAGPWEGIAGWEGDGYDQGYGYATAGLLLGDGGHVVVPVRLSASYLYYNYRTQTAEISVWAPGAAGSAGLRLVRGWGSLTLLGGGELRWERRQRNSAPGPWTPVARGGAVVQSEADLKLGARLRPFLLFNYAGSSRYLYGRASLRWQCNNLDWSGPTAWFLALEGVGQGNRDTDAAQAGAAVECSLTRARLSLSLHGGWKSSASSDSSRRTGGYIGAGIYRRF